MGSVKQRQNFLGRAGEHRPVTADDYRSLHQHRVLQQQADNRVAGDIVRRLQAKVGELPVLADQVGWCIREQVKELLEVGAGRRLLEVLDDVELDVPLAQNVQRAAAVASAGVEVDAKLFHGGAPKIGQLLP